VNVTPDLADEKIDSRPDVLVCYPSPIEIAHVFHVLVTLRVVTIPIENLCIAPMALEVDIKPRKPEKALWNEQ
jgi:hypothetical protein